MRINNINFKNIVPQVAEPAKRVESGKEMIAEEPRGLVDFVNELLNWSENEKVQSDSAKWDLSRIPLKFFINNCNENEKFLPEFIEAIQSAFLPWSRASAGLIRFERVYNEAISDITINWADSMTIGREYEAGNADLKVINGKIERAEINIVIFPVIDNFANKQQRIERVRRTALHELGHALGLKHSNSKKDMMYYRGINNSALSNNDVKRLTDLYSSNKVLKEYY